MSRRRRQIFILILLLLLAFHRVDVWQKRRNIALNVCAYLAALKSRPQKVKGSIVLLDVNRARIIDARVDFSDKELPFYGDILVQSAQPLPRSYFGKQVEITGVLQCRIPFRNPSQSQDKLAYLANPVLSVRVIKPPKFLPETANIRSAFSNTFSNWINRLFQNTPNLLALARAVWIGDMSGFPETMQNFYKEVGLLPTLALSGQHVGCLLLLLQFPMHLFLCLLLSLRTTRFLFLYRELSRALPLFGSLLLLFTSPANPPIQRTLAMTLALLILRLRKFEHTTLQVVASTAGILIIWDPSLLMNIGFFLSVVATALLAEVLSGTTGARAFASYLFTSTVMPFLVLPVTAFFFSKVAWTAPLHVVGLAWFWDLFIIPFGFSLPVVALLVPTKFLFYVDQFWAKLCEIHLKIASIVQSHYTTFLKPTWAELVIVECLFLVLIVGLKTRLFSSKKRQ